MSIPTNKVNFELNYDQINKDFFIYQINADSLKGENYKIVVTAIYERIKPLSLVKPESGRYLVLCAHKVDDRASYPSFTIDQVYDLRDIKDRDLARLLIQAIPILKQLKLVSADDTKNNASSSQTDNSAVDDIPASEGVGLYYFQDIEKIINEKVIRSFEIDIKPYKFDDNESVVTIKGTTFTPRDMHKDKSDNYPAKILKQPRFNVTPFLEHIKKGKSKPSSNNDTDYIKRGVHLGAKQVRMSSDMIVVDSKRPDKFFKSKAGVLAQFQRDIDHLLNPYIKLNWKALPTSYRRFSTDTNTDQSYNRIYKLLAAQQFYICDVDSGNPDYANQVKEYLESKGITATIENDNLQEFQVENAEYNQPIHFIIHHDKNYYESREIADPYQQFVQTIKDKRLIKQSLTIESLFGDKGKLNKHMLDNSLTEILVKLEVMLEKMILSEPLTTDWQFITGIYKEDDKGSGPKIPTGYDVLSYYVNDNSLKYCRYEDIEPEAFDIEDIVGSILGEDCVLDNDDHLIICNPHGERMAYLIRESNCLPLPQFMKVDTVMRRLHKAHNHGFEIKWAKEYLALIDDEKVFVDSDKNPNIASKLNELIENHAGEPKLTYKTFNQYKIGYRSREDKDFIDWLDRTHGYLFNTGLRGKERGYLEAVKGFFYSEETQSYFSGSTSNLKADITNFNVMRKIHSEQPLSEAPEQLLELMNAYYIRHRQSTVLPFLFKHLREFVRIQECS